MAEPKGFHDPPAQQSVNGSMRIKGVTLLVSINAAALLAALVLAAGGIKSMGAAQQQLISDSADIRTLAVTVARLAELSAGLVEHDAAHDREIAELRQQFRDLAQRKTP